MEKMHPYEKYYNTATAMLFELPFEHTAYVPRSGRAASPCGGRTATAPAPQLHNRHHCSTCSRVTAEKQQFGHRYRDCFEYKIITKGIYISVHNISSVPTFRPQRPVRDQLAAQQTHARTTNVHTPPPHRTRTAHLSLHSPICVPEPLLELLRCVFCAFGFGFQGFAPHVERHYHEGTRNISLRFAFLRRIFFMPPTARTVGFSTPHFFYAANRQPSTKRYQLLTATK